MSELHVVTGAFGYTGRYIAERLIAQGKRVRTLTNSPDRVNPFGENVEVHPFNFDSPQKLVESLRGVKVLYNTYWVRFNHKLFTHAQAVANTKVLFAAAKEAGVERIVHVSITKPSLDSPLEYFSGKAELEQALKETGVSYAILRPAVLFGGRDILINNIAWVVRRFPLIGVFGDGKYRLQPLHVEDMADLAVAQGTLREDVTIDAIGPETFTYKELMQEVAKILGKKRLIIGVPPVIGFAVGWVVGKMVGDVTITRDEIKGLMWDLLYTDSPPAGERKLTDWARAHKDELGRRYANEVGRRIEKRKGYEEM